MYIQEIKIKNYKCFTDSEEQEYKFNCPDGKTKGSGLNILTGKNNSGKSSLLETIKFSGDIEDKTIDEDVVNFKARKAGEDIYVRLISNSQEGLGLEYNSQLYKGKYKNHKLSKILEKGVNDVEKKATFMPKVYHVSPNRYLEKKIQFGQLSGRVSQGRQERVVERRDDYKIIPEIEAMGEACRDEFNSLINSFLPDISGIDIKTSSRHNYACLVCILSTQNKDKVDLQDMGSGIEQFVILVWLLKYSGDNNIFLIDEPEVFLHPQAQNRLLQLIIQESKNKQIFMSTHSNHLIRPELADKIYRFQNTINGVLIHTPNSTVAKQIEKASNRKFFPYHHNLFFTDFAIFVEGVKDYENYVEFCIDNKFEELMDCFYLLNSKHNVDFFEKFCLSFGIEFFAIVDNDFSFEKPYWKNKVRAKNVGDVLNFIEEKGVEFNKDLFVEKMGEAKNKSIKAMGGKKKTKKDEGGFLKVVDRNIVVLNKGEIEDYFDVDGKVIDLEREKELKAIFKYLKKAWSKHNDIY
jgi:predicted ATP-dependent endonuclease of OLD family